MKSLAKIFFCGAAIFGMTVLFSSCTDTNEPEPGPEKPDMVGQSIFVPNEMNAEVTVSMEFEADDWTISNTNTWMDVYPYSGNAGVQEITVEVLGLNEELTERVAGFMVKDNGSNIQYYVIQDPVAGWNITSRTASVSGEAQSYTFSVQGNLDFEAVVAEGVDWLTIDSITESDSSLLADNATYSAYRTYNINMSVAANDGEVRTAEITLNGVDGVTTATIEVSQMGELVADFSRDFYRRTLGIRFTATTCGYCPMMSEAMTLAYEETGGRFLPFTIYGIMAGSDWWVYDYWLEWMNAFATRYFPRGIVNGYAVVENNNPSTNAAIFTQLTEEARTNIPANTVIGGTVSVSGSNVDANISVASKEAGVYTIGVFLMESHIVGQQSGAGASYEHNFVVKDEFTHYMGDDLSLSTESVQELTYTMPIPSTVEDINNCYVCVWIAKDDTFSGQVSGVLYADYNMLIDNVVNIPVNGFALFEYEN